MTEKKTAPKKTTKRKPRRPSIALDLDIVKRCKALAEKHATFGIVAPAPAVAHAALMKGLEAMEVEDHLGPDPKTE